MSHNDKQLINIDFYEGFDGPTLRIATRRQDGLKLLSDIFQNLAENKMKSIALHLHKNVRTKNIEEIHFITIDRDNRNYQLINHKIGESGLNLVWQAHTEDWIDCIYLLDSLIKGDVSAHQYLGDSDIDSLTILVSYRE